MQGISAFSVTNATEYRFILSLFQIKKALKIIAIVAASFILLAFLLLAALQTRTVQNYLVQKATEILSDELRTKVQIASVDIPFFNKISLNGLYLEDRQGDTLIYANRLKAGFSVRQLFNNRLVFRNVELKKPHIYLSVDTNNVSNLQFLLDAFKSDKPSSSTMEYEIENVAIIDAVFRFDNHNFPRKENGFDAQHIFVKDFSTNLSLHQLSKEILSFEIEKLQFKEQSGFELNNLTLSLNADTQNATISDLSIRMPHTDLNFDTIRITYDSIAAFKNNWEKVFFDFKIKPSNITPADLKAFSAPLGRFDDKVFISTNFKGSFSNMKIRNFSTSYNNSFLLNGDFEFSGLPNLQETFIYANIKNIETDKARLQDLISGITQQPFVLPEQLKNLGKIQYKGNISGLMDNLVAYGTLRTNAGSLSLDVMLNFTPAFDGFDYSGKLQANKLRPYIVLGDSSSFKELSFNLSSKGKINANGDFEGDVEGNISSINIKDYLYSNILLEGSFNKKLFEGQVSLDDPNAKFSFQGVFDASREKLSGEFGLNIDHLNLHNLHLIKSYPDLDIACQIRSNFSAENFDTETTELLIDSIWLSKTDEKYFLKKFYVKSSVSDTINTITIDSHLMQGIIKGDHYFRGIQQSFGNIFGQYVSLLAPKQKSEPNPKANNFVFYFSNFNINSLAEFLTIDFEISPYSSIAGFYNDITEKFRMEVSSPYIRNGKTSVKNFYFLANNPENAIDLFASTQFGDETKLQLESRTSNDSVLINLDWNNSDFVGTLGAVSLLKQNNEGKLLLDINLVPSDMWIQNTEWNIHEGKIRTDLKTINISDFSIKSNDKYININGIASESIHDSIIVDLRQIPLFSIMSLVGVTDPKLESSVSGRAVVYSAFKELILNLNIDAQDFTFNNSLWGNVKARSNWDHQAKVLYADFLISKANDTVASVKGSYRKDSLDFRADARQLPLDFLRYYLDSSVKNISGIGTGKVHLFGSFKQFKMDGDVMVNNGQFDVDFLKTTYQFSDIVHLKPTEIRFDNIQVFDKNKNTGTVTGRITHNSFKDMRFNFNIACKNLMAMNTTAKDNPEFYGKAFATGTVLINGNSDQISFNINAKSEPNTRVVIPMQGSENASENSFIKYVNNHTVIVQEEGIVKSSKKKRKSSGSESSTVLKMSIQLEATPDAAIVLITDPFTGDSVRATGNGNLRLDYASNADMKLSGNYTVEKGSYIFSLQEVIRKPFTIKQGSSLSWNGDPSHPVVNIDAIYTVPSVSLLNILDQADLDGLSRTNVPVNCLLNLTGDLMQPNIKFDIEIPSEAEVERRVKAVINTDEMMNREILALLLANQFYRPDYLAPTGGDSNLGMSLLASTVSGQLNSMLGQLGDKFNIGLNAQVAQDNSSEYDVAFQYQPNSRLIISSNVGYHSNTATTNSSSSNFTGDLDIEYKLTRSGKWRAKAYTHSADNNYYDTNGDMKMTQGVGIMYREDFNKFSEVIRAIFSRKQKTPNDSIK